MHSAPRTNWYRLKQEQDRQELTQLESEYQKRVKNLEEMDDKRKIRVADKVKQQHSLASAAPGRQRAGTVGGTSTASASNKSWSSVVKDTSATTSGTTSSPTTPSTLRVDSASSPSRASRAGGATHTRQRSNGSASSSPGRVRGASPSRSSIQAGTVRKMQGSFNTPTGSPTSASATSPTSPPSGTTSAATTASTSATTTTSSASSTTSTSSAAKVSYAKAASSPTSENRTRLATRSVTTAASARATSPSAYAPYAPSAAPYSPASAAVSASSASRSRIARSPSTVSPAISAIASTFSGPNVAPSSARAASTTTSTTASATTTSSAPSSARGTSSTSSVTTSSPVPTRSATSANVRSSPSTSPKTTAASSTASPRPSITVTTASSTTASRSALSSPTATPASPSATRARSVTSTIGSRPTSPPSVGSTPTASPRGPSPTATATGTTGIKRTTTTSTASPTTSSRATSVSGAKVSASSSPSTSPGTSSPAKSPPVPRVTTASKSTGTASSTSTSKTPTPGKAVLATALLKGTKLEMRGSILVHAHGEQVLVWNIAEQDCILQFAGHSAPVHTVAIRSESVIVSASTSETLAWDFNTGKLLHSAVGCTAMAAHPTLEQVIVATKGEGAAAPKLQILHVPSLTTLQSMDVNSAKGESLKAIAWSSETHLLVAIGSTVKHLDLKAKSFSASFSGQPGAILQLECFSNTSGSANATHFFSLCDQGHVLCFHVGSAKVVSKTKARGSNSTLFLLDDRNSQKLTSQLLPILIHPEGITTIAAKDDSIKMNDPDSSLPLDVITASTPVLLL